VVGDSARGEISEETWETLSGGSECDQRAAEYITVARPGRESERPILAKKRGNARFDALFYGPQGPGQRADVKLVRYADDFVALAKQMGSETIEFIESRLEVSSSWRSIGKDAVVDLREEGASLDFLGYTFRYDRDLKGRDENT